MSLWDSTFFGQTSLSKKELFVQECIYVSRTYNGMSYWDAYLLPIPIRKLMLQQFIESQKTEESNPEPLNLSSKEKYKAQSAPAAQQNKVEKKITPPSHVASMYKSSKKA